MEPTLIRRRADTLENWLLIDPVIPARQKIVVTDTGLEYLGDGVSKFSELTPLGIEGPAGANGLSAFELAQADGYVGTIDEWLLDLYGDDGLSAYEVAVENGFSGTVAEWLESLKGEPGTGSGGGIPEAPLDGGLYVRQDGAWVAAPTSTGGSGAPYVGFRANTTANISVAGGGALKPLAFSGTNQSTSFDTHLGVDAATGTWIAPVQADNRAMQFTVGVRSGSGTWDMGIYLKLNGLTVANNVSGGNPTGAQCFSSGPLLVRTGDIISVEAWASSSETVVVDSRTFLAGTTLD